MELLEIEKLGLGVTMMGREARRWRAWVEEVVKDG